MTLLVNIVGAGKLGKTIGWLLVNNKLANIAGLITRSKETAEAALRFIGDGNYCPSIHLLPPANIYLISTPDDNICQTTLEICRGEFSPGTIFVHCSGVLSSEILSAVKIKGGLVVSIHPMKSFAEPATAIKNYEGTYCAMEGDEKALKIIKPLFEAFGSIVYTIEREKKPLYHAAGVFASNYLVTLAQQASECLAESGVGQEMVLKIIIHLMQGTLANMERAMNLSEALTGPIKRGDISTLKKHLAVFSDQDKKVLYSILGKATLNLTTHPLQNKSQMESVLFAMID